MYSQHLWTRLADNLYYIPSLRWAWRCHTKWPRSVSLDLDRPKPRVLLGLLLCGSHLQMVLIGKDPAAGSGDGVDRGGGLVSKCRAISESSISPFTSFYCIIIQCCSNCTCGRKGPQMKSYIYHWFDKDIKGCNILSENSKLSWVPCFFKDCSRHWTPCILNRVN